MGRRWVAPHVCAVAFLPLVSGTFGKSIINDSRTKQVTVEAIVSVPITSQPQARTQQAASQNATRRARTDGK
jgi:hypothetical protein